MCLAIKTTNRWPKHWSMLMMTGAFRYWRKLWVMVLIGKNMPHSPKDTRFISTLPPASCADWTVKATGVHLSIPVLPITAMMIIVKVPLGNGPGSCLMMWTDW